MVANFKDLSLEDQVNYFAPALGIKDEEVEIVCLLVKNAPEVPSPRKLERELGLKRAFIKAIYNKLEAKGYIKFNEDTVDFSGLIKALKEIPLDRKKKLFEKIEKRFDEPIMLR